MKYPLKYPVIIKAENEKPETELKTLTFGRIKAKHLKLIPFSCFEEGGGELKPDEVIPLIAGLANVDLELAGEIDLMDLMSIIGEILPHFLSEYQPAKKKDSE